MKQLVTRYTFNPAAGTITFDDYVSIDLARVLLIINVTDGVVIYNFADPAKGATVSGNVITLDYNTGGMSASDRLQIHYNTSRFDPQADMMVVGNRRSFLRDGFSDPSIVQQPDPEHWDIYNPHNHLINRGGNAAGSSYLRISMSVLPDDTEVILTSKQTFALPFRAAAGLSISQRIAGQECTYALVGVDASTRQVEYTAQPADIPITGATATVASNVATFTAANHGLRGGQRVVIFGCAEKRLNVSPVLVTIVDANTFTVPCTLSNASYSSVGGQVRLADPSANAKNTLALVFDATTVTTAQFAARNSGAPTRQIATGVATTASVQSNANPYTDAFVPTASYELVLTGDEAQQRSTAVDSTATSSTSKVTSSVPDDQKRYKIQFRVKTFKGTSVPVGKITAASKTGTTTATITTDIPHGLVVGDYVQIFGIRDQTNFANLTTQTVVASIVSSTQFTIIMGSAVTASSLGGLVYLCQGSVGLTAFTGAIQSVVRTNGVMTVIGSATWTAIPGEFIDLYGMTGDAAQYDGAYKVLRVSTTTMELEAPGPDFVSINSGGAAIRRTEYRLHFAQVLDWTRHQVEIQGGRGNTTDGNNAVPVTLVAGTSQSVTQSTGSASAMWNAAGFGGVVGADVASAAITATATTAAVVPGIAATPNQGTYAHSFNVIVTAVSGTNPTLDVGVEESMDNGANWIRIYDFPRITAAGAYTSPLIRAQYGTRYRYVQTISGTTPSFTRAINRSQFASAAPLVRQFFDRSIVLTTLNSTTPVYNVDGCDSASVYVAIGAATTPPQIQLQGSEDGATWYAIGAPLAAVANSVVALTVQNIMPKFIRGLVSTAGAAVTANYVSLKAIGR